jgi:hypothetical protein
MSVKLSSCHATVVPITLYGTMAALQLMTVTVYLPQIVRYYCCEGLSCIPVSLACTDLDLKIVQRHPGEINGLKIE